MAAVPHLSPAAPPEDRPALSISQAAIAAEKKLSKLGLSDAHYIASISLYPARDGRPAHYRANVLPLLIFDPKAKKNDPRDGTAWLSLRIEMDGVVVSERTPGRGRRRTIPLK